jgi:hypothetical protein
VYRMPWVRQSRCTARSCVKRSERRCTTEGGTTAHSKSSMICSKLKLLTPAERAAGHRFPDTFVRYECACMHVGLSDVCNSCTSALAVEPRITFGWGTTAHFKSWMRVVRLDLLTGKPGA